MRRWCDRRPRFTFRHARENGAVCRKCARGCLAVRHRPTVSGLPARDLWCGRGSSGVRRHVSSQRSRSSSCGGGARDTTRIARGAGVRRHVARRRSLSRRLGSHGGGELLPDRVRLRSVRRSTSGTFLYHRDSHEHAGPSRALCRVGRRRARSHLRVTCRACPGACRGRVGGSRARADRIRDQGGNGAASLLAARGARGFAVAHLRAHVWRGDQDGDLRPDARGDDGSRACRLVGMGRALLR